MVIAQIDPLPARQSGMETVDGLIVTTVRLGSVADLSGITNGEIIAEVDGLPARTLGDLEGSLIGRTSREPIRILLRGVSAWRFVTIPYRDFYWPE
jgi:membrane-associated protease RseP (regulator of RpoE activity)